MKPISGFPTKRVPLRAVDPQRVPLRRPRGAAPDGAAHRLRRLQGLLPAAEEPPGGGAIP